MADGNSGWRRTGRNFGFWMAGASLSRRNFGESLGFLTLAFPYWFCRNFSKYSENENLLPFDQHALIALMAPRAVYIASATEDLWAEHRPPPGAGYPEPCGAMLARLFFKKSEVRAKFAKHAKDSEGGDVQPGQQPITLRSL